MKFAIETEGVLEADDAALDRATLEAIFDVLSEALARTNKLEADVSINFATRELEFYVVVEAQDSRSATAAANAIVDGALEAAGIGVQWAEAHTRRAEEMATA